VARKHQPPVEDVREELELLRAQNEALQTRLYALQSAHRVLQGEDEEYSALRHRIRQAVRERLPLDETILVVSKGDAELVDLYGRPAWHFPRQADGRWAGFYPKRSISAIAHLEAMRARGACYLLIPETSRWWLDHYRSFRLHLERRYEPVLDDRDSCLIYAIRKRKLPAADPEVRLEQVFDDFLPVLGEDPSVLDWETGLSLQAAFPERTVFSPSSNSAPLPYLDDTVDIVVVGKKDRAVLREAERVASKLVVDLSAAEADEAPRLGWRIPPDGVTPASVSIVIPCHDGLAYTEACLATLCETLPAWYRGEIVVVDDASSDGTSDFLKRLSRKDDRIRVVRHRSSKGFLESCHRGADESQSDYLLFLNNDTVLLPGWLAPLISTYERFEDAGAVGGKLLFEDGRLQEAGGLVYSDASASKVGYFDPDVEAPIYDHLREVDYVSAAFMLTPRSLFQEIGGFDRRYGFGYYDDDDYCFAVRASGRRVYYQPESVIVHVEGASAGTDVSVGLKRLQIENQKIFAEKWRDVLKRHPARPDPLDGRGVAIAATLRSQYARADI
jgi:GT2 family glycosyltransferase